ncbi:MAG: hypothetical protein KOO69_05260, partial [Victivallales bacterium]|nr:hypothetical protein [Victivallales bacterium]
IKISVYIYEKKKTVKIAKGNKKYKLTGLLALSVFGTFGVEGTISESKKHGFKNRLLNIVNYIEDIVSKSREKKRDFRLGCLKTRRQEQRKVRANTRKCLFSSLKHVEKREFDSLLNNATMHNNCNIMREYIKAMECQWRKESNNFIKEQKNKLKEAKILIDRYDPLVTKYKNLQDLYIDNAMMNKPWSEIQKVIDNWLEIT